MQPKEIRMTAASTQAAVGVYRLRGECRNRAAWMNSRLVVRESGKHMRRKKRT